VKLRWLPLAAATGAICLTGPVLAQTKTAAKAAAPAAKGATGAGSKFAVDIQYGKHGKGGSARFWVKGDQVREEKKSGGGLRVTLISNDEGVFVKNKYSNVWAKMPKAVAFRLVDRLLGGPAGEPKQFLKERKAKKVGIQKWEGQPCEVWSYSASKNVEKYKLWLSAKSGKPVRLERDALLGGKFREKIIITYTNFAWNVPLEDALFKVPANETVREFKNPLQPAQSAAPKQ
jgi:outer membrane lipoprotein-sorting protein